jgi:putative membrane protein
MVMMDWGDGMWGGGNWIMFLLAIAFLVAVIVGIVFVVRALSGSGTGGDHQVPPRERETAEELVRRRYAAGEIDREEYEQKLRDLSG